MRVHLPVLNPIVGGKDRNFLCLGFTRCEWTGRFEGSLCCNMIHISPWDACLGLFAKLSKHLYKSFLSCRPFIQDDVETCASNLSFDQSLRNQNPLWGLRNLREVCKAENYHFRCSHVYEMPANNLAVIYTRMETER